MNYENQIEHMRNMARYAKESLYEMSIEETLLAAADIIETLSAEREAMMKTLHGECYLCKHQNSDKFDYPCWHCENGNGLDDLWELREFEVSEE